ncbi:hypothetical protein KC19_2G072800 [Ceratodon purpureus]|uniref:Uncharacterized protein n=1 Tax=Ceratodon purpureus TaxID=3225 RepID=A0A8T0ITU2_CERPU|nr:hypothetical protein KC19_2G072800 [Ceratodon purpureus]
MGRSSLQTESLCPRLAAPPAPAPAPPASPQWKAIAVHHAIPPPLPPPPSCQFSTPLCLFPLPIPPPIALTTLSQAHTCNSHQTLSSSQLLLTSGALPGEREREWREFGLRRRRKLFW